MIRLPALTVWQPWASLIVAKAKPWEFRGHAAPKAFRGRQIAIHAGMRKPRETEIRALLRMLKAGRTTGLVREIAEPLLWRWLGVPDSLPLGTIIGTAILGEPILASEIPDFAGAFANDSDRARHANWAWPLTGMRPLEPPVPMRGAQGFWTCEIDREAA